MDTALSRDVSSSRSTALGLARLLRWILLPLALLAVLAADPRPVEALGPAVDQQDALQIFNRDVYELDGASLRNPTADTDADAQLYSIVGAALPVTWGEWGEATARSTVITTGGASPHTLALIRFSGLIPNGVYSVFYGTFGPDSEHPGCPGVERTLPFTSIAPGRLGPDASSFVADEDGNAYYLGRVEGDLLAASQLFFSIVYHFDGDTYHPYPNRGEFFTHDQATPCRSTYGEDAMRQLLILQKN